MGLAATMSACGSGFDDSDKPQESGKASLQVLIGSSGDAETNAVKAAAAAWASSSGNTATITPAQDIGQQLGQAFAGDSPPDVFYVDASRFADYAKVGALEPYGDKYSGGVNDFYPNLRATFTHEGKLYCVPKDFSTLTLQVNNDLFTKAGLGTADIPTTWEQLTSVSQKLKAAGVTPLVIGDTRDRIGAFMVEAGGWIVNSDGTKANRRHPAEPSGAPVRPGSVERRPGGVPQAGGRRLGWRGFRQGQGRHGHRGQLDQGCHAERLPDGEVHRRADAGRPEGQGHAVVHPVLGHLGEEQVQGPGESSSWKR